MNTYRISSGLIYKIAHKRNINISKYGWCRELLNDLVIELNHGLIIDDNMGANYSKIFERTYRVVEDLDMSKYI